MNANTETKEAYNKRMAKEIAADFFMCPESVLTTSMFFKAGFLFTEGDVIEAINGKLIVITRQNIEKVNKSEIKEPSWVVSSKDVLETISNTINRCRGELSAVSTTSSCDFSVGDYCNYEQEKCKIIGIDPLKNDNFVISTRNGCNLSFISVNRSMITRA